MATKMVILWPRTESVGTRTDQDPRVPELRDNVVKRLQNLGIDVVETHDKSEVHIGDADIFYSGTLPPDLLDKANNLKWMHSSVAGMDGFWYPELRETDFPITNARGIYSDVISDHLFTFLLCFARGMHAYIRAQKSERWDQKGTVPLAHLEHATLGIVGLGGIGLAVAARGHTSGMRILGVDPAPKDKPDYIEQIWPPENLHDMLAESDFVAICVPHTGETEHMIDAAALQAMKNTAVIMNIGRGKVIDLQALTEALQKGELGGAGLDVFEQEPLPEDHLLWDMDNVIITPHVAGRSAYPYQEARRMDLLVENTRRFLNNEPLLNVLDKQKGYVVASNT